MLLSLKSINVSYGKISVIKNVSLDVPDKKIVTVLGANGAGKTTLMRTISGLVKPINGEIIFHGIRIDRLSTSKIVKKGISMVPEERQIFPQMTVDDNIKMGAYSRKDKADIKQDLERVYSLFPILKERKNQISVTLSGGEQQMLVIGRALMSKPKLLLLDEPSFGLAPTMVEQIFDIIKNINSDDGLAILLVEQNANLALSISHFGYIMETGEIILHDEAERLKNNENVKKTYLGEEVDPILS